MDKKTADVLHKHMITDGFPEIAIKLSRFLEICRDFPEIACFFYDLADPWPGGMREAVKFSRFLEICRDFPEIA